jgi:xanthine dehydrogenase FAD-binding subunit
MKFLPPFEYLVPESLREACSLLGRYGSEACVLAGGTDLLINLKRGEMVRRYVLDVGRIGEMSGIRDEGSHIFIGATTTHTMVAESELIRRESPLLSEAASSVGSVQIRNSGTIGGNIINGSPAADTLPPLIALSAEALVASSTGERSAPVQGLLLGPYRTGLAGDELLVGVRFAKPPHGSGTSFLKLGRRRALSVSRMTVAAVLVLDREGVIEKARICPGAVMPIPSRAVRAEEGLLGLCPGPEVFRKAGEEVAEEMVRVTGIRPSTPYKEPVLMGLVQRALTAAAGRCQA